jgi:ribosomal-protein-alanine N-acetyltransferase
MGLQYRIRRAVLQDLSRIQEIENSSFGREAYDCKLFAYYFHRCGGLFLVAERKGRICGYIITLVRGAGRAELVSVAVDPAVRGSGAASALLESTLRRLRQRLVARLHLVVRVGNRAALAFYEKYGFRRLRRVPAYYGTGRDGVAMSRPVRLTSTTPSP